MLAPVFLNTVRKGAGVGIVVFNLTTFALLLLIFTVARETLGDVTLRTRGIPWYAVGLTALAVLGVLVELCWPGAMNALDDDPARSGWWRPLTAVFMQNGGVPGAAYNLVTLAVIAALAQWLWRGPLMLACFLAGALGPHYIDVLVGAGGVSTDPRDFAGSSGATYFLGATLAGAALRRGPGTRIRLLALAAPAAGLLLWFAQSNAHGLVVVYGFVLGAVVWGVPRARVPADAR